MSATAYPLCWPQGWPVTERNQREKARFQTSLPRALQNLKNEVTLLGGKNLVLSSNYTLGCDHPTNPGVVAYFVLDGANIAVPCDRWLCVEHNVQAIALTIEAMRGMDRWGAKHMIKAMFTGFKTLPAPGESSGIDPWKVLGIPVGALGDDVTAAYRRLAQTEHPDKGGTAERFNRIKQAHDMIVNNRR